MTDEPNTQYDWYDTFISLKYKAGQRGLGETKFSSCVECLKEELEDFFNKADMQDQGKAMGVEVIFVPCDKHAGATV